MQISIKRYVIVVILLLVTGILTFGAYNDQSYSGILYTQNVPMAIGIWSGMELSTAERTYEVLETRDMLASGSGGW